MPSPDATEAYEPPVPGRDAITIFEFADGYGTAAGRLLNHLGGEAPGPDQITLLDAPGALGWAIGQFMEAGYDVEIDYHDGGRRRTVTLKASLETPHDPE